MLLLVWFIQPCWKHSTPFLIQSLKVHISPTRSIVSHVTETPLLVPISVLVAVLLLWRDTMTKTWKKTLPQPGVVQDSFITILRWTESLGLTWAFETTKPVTPSGILPQWDHIYSNKAMPSNSSVRFRGVKHSNIEPMGTILTETTPWNVADSLSRSCLCELKVPLTLWCYLT